MFIISKETERNNLDSVFCFSGIPFKIFEKHDDLLFGYMTDKIGRSRKDKGYFPIKEKNVLGEFDTYTKAKKWFDKNGSEQTEKNCKILSYIANLGVADD